MHFAHRCGLPQIWPARCLSGGHRGRCIDRPAGHACCHPGLVLAVLPGDLLWRQLRRRGAVVSFCGRRWGCTRPARTGTIARHGRWRGRGRGGAAIGDLDHGSVATAYVCHYLPGAGTRGSALGARPARGKATSTQRCGNGQRPAAHRNRTAAAFHCRGDLWRGVLYVDELPDDCRTAGNAYLRASAGLCQPGDAMACHRDVRAEFLHGFSDCTIRSKPRGDRGPGAHRAVCRRRTWRRRRGTLLGHADPARPWVEFRIPRRIGAGAGVPPPRGEDARAVPQRLHRLWPDGDRLFFLRRPVVRLWLENSAVGLLRSARAGLGSARRGDEKEQGPCRRAPKHGVRLHRPGSLLPGLCSQALSPFGDLAKLNIGKQMVQGDSDPSTA
ncbi:hypothetical protein CBM2600_B30189 [Cupriavidus taiwanensis]|nr:hypothetical protein CBM2600_B30189 [Cupriavidus taiwanensis]